MVDARGRYGQLGSAAWAALLFGAGAAAVKLTIETAPPLTRGDFFDSPYLVPAFFGLSLPAAAAGWFAPRVGLWWGLVAASPFFVTLLVQVPSDDQGLWPVGMAFLVVLTSLPSAAAGAASLLRRRLRG
jgi:hypothetical protein